MDEDRKWMKIFSLLAILLTTTVSSTVVIDTVFVFLFVFKCDIGMMAYGLYRTKFTPILFFYTPIFLFTVVLSLTAAAIFIQKRIARHRNQFPS